MFSNNKCHFLHRQVVGFKCRVPILFSLCWEFRTIKVLIPYLSFVFSFALLFHELSYNFVINVLSFQVHQLLNGHEKQIFPIGLTITCQTQNAMRKTRDGHHSHIVLHCTAKSLHHYIELHHTLSSSKCFNTVLVSLF